MNNFLKVVEQLDNNYVPVHFEETMYCLVVVDIYTKCPEKLKQLLTYLVGFHK